MINYLSSFVGCVGFLLICGGIGMAVSFLYVRVWGLFLNDAWKYCAMGLLNVVA